jgi:hypothetical protein
MGPKQKAYFIKFSLPVNFVARKSSLWFLILDTRERIPDLDHEKRPGSLQIRIRNTTPVTEESQRLLLIILFHIMFAVNVVNYDPWHMEIIKNGFNAIKR